MSNRHLLLIKPSPSVFGPNIAQIFEQIFWRVVDQVFRTRTYSVQFSGAEKCSAQFYWDRECNVQYRQIRKNLRTIQNPIKDKYRTLKMLTPLCAIKGIGLGNNLELGWVRPSACSMEFRAFKSSLRCRRLGKMPRATSPNSGMSRSTIWCYQHLRNLAPNSYMRRSTIWCYQHVRNLA